MPETADSVPTVASGVGPTGAAAEVLELGRSVRLKLGATLVALVGSFLASVILSRALGREDYGLLVLVYSVAGLALVLSDFGAKSTLIRYLPARRPDAESSGSAAELAASALLIQLAGAALCALVILGTANLLADRFFRVPALSWPLAIGALYFVGIALRDFVAQLYQSLQDWKREALVGVVFTGSQLLVLGLWVTFADLTVTAALIITGGCAFGSAVLGLGLVRHWTWRRAGALLRVRTVSEHAALVWRFGLPLKAVALSFYALSWADKLMLGWWRQPGEVATYYLAGLFIGAMMTVVNVLTLVLTPYVSKISTMDQDYIRVRFQVLFRWFLHGATLLAVTVFFLVEPFVGLAFGPDYADAVPLFRMLLPVFVLRAGWVAYGIFAMNAYNLVKESVALSSLLGCAVLIFDLALIPSFGAPGAIAATFLAYGLTRVITLVTVAHMRRIVPMPSIARALGAAVLVVGSAHMLRPAGTPAALACGVAAPAVYCLALALLSELTRRDWEVVKMVATAAWQPLAMAGHRS